MCICSAGAFEDYIKARIGHCPADLTQVHVKALQITEHLPVSIEFASDNVVPCMQAS